ncbi:MAG: hypothetical protein AVDCRST_MAG49-2103, partial [uncultured Thermomicrobiales bacterium]
WGESSRAEHGASAGSGSRWTRGGVSPTPSAPPPRRASTCWTRRRVSPTSRTWTPPRSSSSSPARAPVRRRRSSSSSSAAAYSPRSCRRCSATSRMIPTASRRGPARATPEI